MNYDPAKGGKALDNGKHRYDTLMTTMRTRGVFRTRGIWNLVFQPLEASLRSLPRFPLQRSIISLPHTTTVPTLLANLLSIFATIISNSTSPFLIPPLFRLCSPILSLSVSSQQLSATPLAAMLPVRQSRVASTKMPTMLLLDYVELGRTIMRGGGHGLLQQHYKQYDALGGIDAFNLRLIESGVDTSSVVKHGMALSDWCDNHTFLPVNAFGAPMADQVNRMTDFRAAIVGAGTILAPQFLEVCKVVMKDKTHFQEACKAVLENQTCFSEACKLMMKNEKGCLEACETVLATKTWYFEACEAMSEIKTWFLHACENFLEIRTWISVVCEFVTGNKKTSFGLMVSVIALGVMLGKGRWWGGKDVLKSGDTNDHDNDVNLLDVPQTEAGDDANNNDEKDSEQFSGAMCRVTMDESGAHSAPKAPPPWAWGHIAPGKKNMRVTRGGKTMYNVNVKNKIKWFRADQVKFEDEKTFHGHDLRKRIRVQVKV